MKRVETPSTADKKLYVDFTYELKIESAYADSGPIKNITLQDRIPKFDKPPTALISGPDQPPNLAMLHMEGDFVTWDGLSFSDVKKDEDKNVIRKTYHLRLRATSNDSLGLEEVRRLRS